MVAVERPKNASHTNANMAVAEEQKNASRNINVNAVAPGFIQTEMTAKLPEELKEKMMEAIPLGRFGLPDDVAAACVFLASEDAGYITGQTIVVDGGMVMA